jgi:hypothetical protein
MTETVSEPVTAVTERNQAVVTADEKRNSCPETVSEAVTNVTAVTKQKHISQKNKGNPVTPRYTEGVTGSKKLNPLREKVPEAVTPVTPVTPEKHNSQKTEGQPISAETVGQVLQHLACATMPVILTALGFPPSEHNRSRKGKLSLILKDQLHWQPSNEYEGTDRVWRSPSHTSDLKLELSASHFSDLKSENPEAHASDLESEVQPAAVAEPEPTVEQSFETLARHAAAVNQAFDDAYAALNELVAYAKKSNQSNQVAWQNHSSHPPRVAIDSHRKRIIVTTLYHRHWS